MSRGRMLNAKAGRFPGDVARPGNVGDRRPLQLGLNVLNQSKRLLLIRAAHVSLKQEQHGAD